ncbi:MAG: cytochrome c3 family protein [Acidobacteriia bacterium]|nr:cytochrome c3 family protein [Terriglobia bacterium]
MRLGAAILFCVGPALLAQAPEPRYQRPAPEQPLPYSHLKHAGELKIACAECHPIPGNGDFATLPATAKCMTCHVAVKEDSPHIQKLAGWHAKGVNPRWAPVYRIPNYVSFNHRKHVSVEGVNCGTCHGPVAEREVMRREKDISMAACMDCHRTKGASNDCLLCHDQR